MGRLSHIASGNVEWYKLYGGLTVRVQPRKEQDHARYWKERGFARENVLNRPGGQKGESEVAESLISGGRSYTFWATKSGSGMTRGRYTTTACISEVAAQVLEPPSR